MSTTCNVIRMKAVQNQVDMNQYIGGFCHDQALIKPVVKYLHLFFIYPLYRKKDNLGLYSSSW